MPTLIHARKRVFRGYITLGTKILFWFYIKGENGVTAYFLRTTAFYNDAPYIDADSRDTKELEAAF
jgi:hypothetical protein